MFHRIPVFLLFVAFCAATAASSVKIVSFDDPSTAHKFVELNDPVMGGKSMGTWTVKQGQYGIFDGEVVDVPSLKAPGFIKAASDGKFPDISTMVDGSLILKVRSTTPEYKGFRVSFASGTIAPSYSCAGGGSIPFSRGCFKAHFEVPEGDDFQTVVVPFTQFSDTWSPATGEHTKNCTSGSDVCPSAKTLGGIKRIEIWAEGALGKVHLEVSAIMAESASVVPLAAEVAAPSRPPAKYDTCKSAVQTALRYNISSFTESMYLPSESVATAVCCDARMQALAEPQFLFEAPNVQLFSLLDKTTGVTTFYDSVCGVPLFRAPVNRSFDDFEADTKEHGWPSFRSEEVVRDHVHTNMTTGYVTSTCGTHLGSYLPDGKGPRWCMDLSCISGSPSK